MSVLLSGLMVVTGTADVGVRTGTASARGWSARLPHRDRDPRCPAAVQFAEAGVAIAVGMPLDVLVPQDLQRDVLALQLAVDCRPVGFGAASAGRSMTQH
jgi:hypothetical protein